MNAYEEWIGRSQTVTDVLDPQRSNALDRALGGKGLRGVGDALPSLHHWLYFWDVQPAGALGADGHPAKGGFLPPVPLPRRMWAGGRVSFLMPLRLGSTVTKTSTITVISEKTGRTGSLVFVTLRHIIESGDGPAISEEQDLVYRAAATEGIAMPVPQPAPVSAWAETLDPDPVLLFRYSALTMNGHRIHYDRPYATSEEHYPALVVHGPLQATLLIRLAEQNAGKAANSFDFRGQSPAFDGLPLHVCGTPKDDGAALWTQQGEAKCMTAQVTFAN